MGLNIQNWFTGIGDFPTEVKAENAEVLNGLPDNIAKMMKRREDRKDADMFRNSYANLANQLAATQDLRNRLYDEYLGLTQGK